MDRSNIIYLVSNSQTQNEYGVFVDNYTERKVYCEVSSISQSEWFEGGRNGLNPQYRFRLFRYDYNGEEVVKYDGEYYSVYRTYIDRNEVIDLYCEKRKGVNG